MPFRGNQQNKQASLEDDMTSIEELRALIDSLPSDVDDEVKRAAATAEARRQVQATLDKMRDVGSFGKGSHNETSTIATKEQQTDEDDFNKSLLDISATF